MAGSKKKHRRNKKSSPKSKKRSRWLTPALISAIVAVIVLCFGNGLFQHIPPITDNQKLQRGNDLLNKGQYIEAAPILESICDPNMSSEYNTKACCLFAYNLYKTNAYSKSKEILKQFANCNDYFSYLSFNEVLKVINQKTADRPELRYTYYIFNVDVFLPNILDHSVSNIISTDGSETAYWLPPDNPIMKNLSDIYMNYYPVFNVSLAKKDRASISCPDYVAIAVKDKDGHVLKNIIQSDHVNDAAYKDEIETLRRLDKKGLSTVFLQPSQLNINCESSSDTDISTEELLSNDILSYKGTKTLYSFVEDNKNPFYTASKLDVNDMIERWRGNNSSRQDSECEGYGGYVNWDIGILGMPNYNDLKSLFNDYDKSFMPRKDGLSTLVHTLMKRNPNKRGFSLLYFNPYTDFSDKNVNYMYVKEMIKPINIVILDIQNISNEPLTINRIDTYLLDTQNDGISVTGTNSIESTIRNRGTRKQFGFPINILKPGDHIIIPSYLYSASFSDNYKYPNSFKSYYKYDGDYLYDFLKSKDYFNGIKPNEHMKLQYIFTENKCDNKEYLKTEKVILSDKILSKKTSFAMTIKRLIDEIYFLGPALKPYSINYTSTKRGTINEEIRIFDTRNVVSTSAQIPMAYCPFVYSIRGNSEYFENTILYKLNGKSKETLQEREIRYFDGNLIIKELEAETSYIDYLLVKIETIDGKTLFFEPDNPLLNKLDGFYLVIKTGSSVHLKFPNYGMQKGRVSIITKGYYTRNH